MMEKQNKKVLAICSPDLISRKSRDSLWKLGVRGDPPIINGSRGDPPKLRKQDNGPLILKLIFRKITDKKWLNGRDMSGGKDKTFNAEAGIFFNAVRSGDAARFEELNTSGDLSACEAPDSVKGKVLGRFFNAVRSGDADRFEELNTSGDLSACEAPDSVNRKAMCKSFNAVRSGDADRFEKKISINRNSSS